MKSILFLLFPKPGHVRRFEIRALGTFKVTDRVVDQLVSWFYPVRKQGSNKQVECLLLRLLQGLILTTMLIMRPVDRTGKGGTREVIYARCNHLLLVGIVL